MADGRDQAAHRGEPVPEVPGYRIESRLGNGSMGVVYLAEDLQLRRKVALKILTPTLAEDELFRKRFDRESQNAATLDHPNIVPVYAAGQANGLLYIAMRYVRGGDLRTLLDSQGQLSLDQASSVIAAVADALDAAHAHGMIHRDVKPANILIDDHAGQKHYYLSDFGITKNVSADRSLTSAGQVIGTIDYIAPEHIQGKAVDARADLYALGCVLYQCLTGVVPFERDDTAALMWAHVQDEPPLVSTRRPDLPPQVDQIVATAMAKKPEDRYPTCRDLALALRAITSSDPAAGRGGTAVLVSAALPPPGAEGMTSTSTVIGAAAQAPAKAPSAGRRKWWWAAGGVLTLALAAGATFGVMTYLRAQFPNTAERTILDKQVPLALKKSCGRNPDADTTQVLASVNCTSTGDGPSTVSFTKYKSPEDLGKQYQQAVATAGTGMQVGDCANNDRAEGAYKDSTGRTSGRIVCYQNLASTTVVWTDDQNRTLGTAIRLDIDYTKLRDWWFSLMSLPTKTQREADARAAAAKQQAEEAGKKAAETTKENEGLKNQNQVLKNQVTEDERKLPDKSKTNTNPNQANQPQPQGGGQQPQPNQPQPNQPQPQPQPQANQPQPNQPQPQANQPQPQGSEQQPQPNQIQGGGQLTQGGVGGPVSCCTVTGPRVAYLSNGSKRNLTTNQPIAFTCQSKSSKDGRWWARTDLGDTQGWVPTAYLAGSVDYGPVPGLPTCDKGPGQ